jgi:hypothetical protein
MKIVAFCFMLLLVFLVLCVPAVAISPSWMWGFSAYSDFQDSGTDGAFSTDTSYGDGYGAGDGMIGTGPKVYFGTYHTHDQQGWSGSTGFYSADGRSPIAPEPSSQKTWTFYVWADPTLGPTASRMVLSWMWLYPGEEPLTDYRYQLVLISKPDEVVGGPEAGAIYDLSVGYGGVQLPVYRSSNGLTGYKFEFSATVIPEPSSLLALGAGLAAMPWMRRRRRLT